MKVLTHMFKSSIAFKHDYDILKINNLKVDLEYLQRTKFTQHCKEKHFPVSL